MQTEAAIKMRRSVRAFAKKPIAPNLIEKLIDAARLAPTARNVQPWEFVAITKWDKHDEGEEVSFGTMDEAIEYLVDKWFADAPKLFRELLPTMKAIGNFKGRTIKA